MIEKPRPCHHGRLPNLPGSCSYHPQTPYRRLFEATREERDALFDLLEEVRQQMLEANPARSSFLKGMSALPDGFNIGINVWSGVGPNQGSEVTNITIKSTPNFHS